MAGDAGTILRRSEPGSAGLGSRRAERRRGQRERDTRGLARLGVGAPHADLIASRPHYADHLAPVARALGQAIQVPAQIAGSHELPGEVHAWPAKPKRTSGWAVVCSRNDVALAELHGWGRLIYLCHGIEQAYSGYEVREPGAGMARVRLVLRPSGRPGRWDAMAPRARQVAVGMPKLDGWAGIPEPSEPCVALTFRWRQPGPPERYTAFDHYRDALPALRADLERRGIRLIGHAHPNLWPEAEPIFREAGIEPVRQLVDVVRRARALACDNSSAMFEWAALDRPVVVLNAPHYRRDVHHGGRFWDWRGVGPNASGPEQLLGAIERSLEDPPSCRSARRAVAGEVLPLQDGRATERAAAAIREAVGA